MQLATDCIAQRWNYLCASHKARAFWEVAALKAKTSVTPSIGRHWCKRRPSEGSRTLTFISAESCKVLHNFGTTVQVNHSTDEAIFEHYLVGRIESEITAGPHIRVTFQCERRSNCAQTL